MKTYRALIWERHGDRRANPIDIDDRPGHVRVHHRAFPEMVVDGETPVDALDRLALALVRATDNVSDPWHRQLVADALLEVERLADRLRQEITI